MKSMIKLNRNYKILSQVCKNANISDSIENVSCCHICRSCCLQFSKDNTKII